MPQRKIFVATEILLLDFELFIGELDYLYLTTVNRMPNVKADWLCTLHGRGYISYTGSKMD